MNVLDLLMQGFSVALTPTNLFLCALGVILGTLVGALPGIGPTGAIAMLLSATYKLGPAGALIMLAGIYYGMQYGGTITAVLMGLPGEASSVVTIFDGYQMAKQGRAGAALGIAAIGSFIGGTLGVVGLMLVGPALANMALKFGPAEYFAVLMMAFSMVTSFAGKSMIRGFISLSLGVIVGLVGLDVITGMPRFTFGNSSLMGGIDFLPIVVGLFGMSEIILNLENPENSAMIKADLRFSKMFPSRRELRQSAFPILRGTAIGFFAGTLPGVGATLASFLSYGVEKLISKEPEKFGKGAIAGIAGPETANNAVTCGAFVPMLSMGIPAGAVSALLLGAIMMFGLQPGPTIFTQRSDVVWGLIASMYIGNVMLVVLNMACVPALVWMMDKIRPYLSTVVLFLSIFGVYSYRGSVTDIVMMIGAGIVGYFMKKLEFPQAPVILGLILGAQAEHNLRMSLTISDGSLAIFFQNPISLGFLAAAFVSLLFGVFMQFGKRKELRKDDLEV
jgi:putative tricarboxylic transport membrane protein